jgi:hypothetical protein
MKTETFEFSDTDIPGGMDWYTAKIACEALGEGWRLPTKEELNHMFQLHEKGLGDFEFYVYWAESEPGILENDWCQSFDGGLQFYYNKINTFYVRPVRSI